MDSTKRARFQHRLGANQPAASPTARRLAEMAQAILRDTDGEYRLEVFPESRLGPDPQMFANFRTGSPVALANYSNPELDRLLDHARVTADPEKRTEDYCAISRIINKEAIWFWTFQNTYYAISTSKLKGLPKIYHGVIDVSDTWLD